MLAQTTLLKSGFFGVKNFHIPHVLSLLPVIQIILVWKLELTILESKVL